VSVIRPAAQRLVQHPLPALAKVFLAFAAAVFLCVDRTIAESAPRTLTEKEVETFRNIVIKREVKRENYLVLERLLAEKRAFFKTVAETLAKEHQVKPHASYTYVAADKTLYHLSTNGVAQGKAPKKTVVKKFKSDEESLPLRKLMVTRQQAENQLAVLAALAEENRQETFGWDAHLRKTFNLAPDVRYQLKKLDGGRCELVELSDEKEK
jgi:hypothetical protein